MGPNGVPLINGRPAPTPVDPKKEAEKLERQITLADASVTDAGGLRLGENRASVYARAGALYWKSDQKNAQSLFQRAINEVANALTSAETESRNKQTQQMNEARILQQVRPTVLNAIANFDPEMAIEGMMRTRTASVARAMAVDPSGKVSDTSGINTSLARSEMALEQHLTMMAAEKNPEKAIKMLQDSLKKGVSNETLALLKKLYAKDPESATSFAADVMSQLQGASFSSDPNDFEMVNVASQILNESLRTPPLKPGSKDFRFDENQIRSLAQKFINFVLTQDYRMNAGRYNTALPIADKYSPASAAALRKAQVASMPSSSRGQLDPDVRRLSSDPKITPADMLQQAKTFAPELRPALYQNAANKLVQAGDINGAMQVLNANFSGTALEQAIASTNSSYASYLIGQGKYAEADQIIDTLPDMNKRNAYIQLATRAYQKDPENNKGLATTVLGKARALLPNRPEDNNDLSGILQVISAYATVDADEAFGMYQSLIPQLNELADANALTQGFQGSSAVRSGEFSMANGNIYYGYFLDPGTFRSLAKSDFERTQKLIDGFTRREMRINFRLQLAENLQP